MCCTLFIGILVNCAGFRSFVEVCVNNQEQAEELITRYIAMFTNFMSWTLLAL